MTVSICSTIVVVRIVRVFFNLITVLAELIETFTAVILPVNAD